MTVKAYVAGPAAPENQDVDQELHDKWSDVRTAVVSYGQRVGTIEKAASVSPDVDTESVSSLADGDILVPPYDFKTLCSLHENSSALRQNVDAMMVNVDAFGHQFTPVIDFDHPDIDETIRNIIIRQKLDDDIDLMKIEDDRWNSLIPTDEEVQKTREKWARISALEKGIVKSYFESINPLCPFNQLRMETRQDIEIMGNAAWEIIRTDPNDVTSKIKEVNHLPFVNMFLLRADSEPQETEIVVRKDEVNFEKVVVEKYFRRFVKKTARRTVYFKEMGDPRIVSRQTGVSYESIEELQEKENHDQVANELLHWKIKAPDSSYGIPRWIGALLSVMGSRASEEVNFLYFDNKAIPPMVMMVSGGRLTESTVKRIESHVEAQIKGRKNFHKILILEALPADADIDSGGNIEHSGKTRIELRPLVNEMQRDGLFQEYDANNIIKVGRSFRLPSVVTGSTKDMNRSTSDTAKALGEEQVFEPQRNMFDARMDSDFLTTARIHFWRYKSNAPVQRIPNDLVENVIKSLREGAITPNEARILLSDAFSIEISRRPEEWANLPPKLAQAVARSSGSQQMDSATLEGSEKSYSAMTKTDSSNDHTHKVLATEFNGELTFQVKPENGHTHKIESVLFEADKTFKLRTSEDSDDSHSHEFKIATPASKTRRTANKIASGLALIRAELEDEANSLMDEFFNKSVLESGGYPED